MKEVNQMKKFRVFFNIEKEERWLNEQLQEGYRCTHVNGFGIYIIEKTDKGYVMGLEYQEYLSRKKLEKYKGIYEDFGWNYITDTLFGGIRYWQKEDDGQIEIFSDRQSKGNYYKRLMGYSLALGVMFLAISFSQYRDSGSLFHEGLWSMKGALFWKALVFETPFVLLNLSPLFIVVFFGSSCYNFYLNISLF